MLTMPSRILDYINLRLPLGRPDLQFHLETWERSILESFGALQAIFWVAGCLCLGVGPWAYVAPRDSLSTMHTCIENFWEAETQFGK